MSSTPRTESELEDLLSLPHPELVEMMSRLSGDVMVLGVAGKMGPSLAVAALRASRQAGVERRILGVARFQDADLRRRLESLGVTTLACDLLDPQQIAGLPLVPNVVFMAGRKFGTDREASVTWATNVLTPALVANHFHASRLVAFSTGCVYPLTSPATGGCTEDQTPEPLGEYAQSCLGRERVLEYVSRRHGTPICLLRLNYAIDLRYGVLHDLAMTLHAGRPVDLGVGHFNCLWQGDAVNQALLALEHCASPPSVLNLTGPETLEVRAVAQRLAEAMQCPIQFTGAPQGNCYLSNSAKATGLFGPPKVSLDQMITWTARWVQSGGRSLGKPTHFEVRNGRF